MLAALLKHGTNKKGTYDVLKNFKVAVPCDDGGSQVLHLGVWLHKQREERLRGTLVPDREALLQVCSALLISSSSVLLYPVLSYPVLSFPYSFLFLLAILIVTPSAFYYTIYFIQPFFPLFFSHPFV